MLLWPCSPIPPLWFPPHGQHNKGEHTLVMTKSIVWLIFFGMLLWPCSPVPPLWFPPYGQHNKGENTLVMAKSIVLFIYFWYAALAMFTSSATWVPTTWTTQQRRTYTSGGKEHSLVGLFLVCCFSHGHANAFHVRGLIESSDGAVINYCKLAT